jgi:selenocysteine-specific elongation factor
MSTLNFNIGVLGHVDSGKTSLARALSTVASTACFDKNPQSQQRGITLDLGFSSFTIDASPNLRGGGQQQQATPPYYEYVQYTLVDCPGHASLIKTIIGGAQIIDMFMLVIDIVKGVQTQTAECLIIGEICCDKMLVVLNKIDLIEPSQRQATIEKMSKRLLKTLESTKFANSPIVAVAANMQQMSGTADSDKENLHSKMSEMKLAANVVQSSKETTATVAAATANMINMDALIETLRNVTFVPSKRAESGQFLFAVDHCFQIKGQGTVMTGTVLSGSVKVNDVRNII